MTFEIVVASSAMVTAVVAVGGVLVTWRKNGKSQGERDASIQLNQENIIKRLDDKDDGLSALGRKMNQMVNHCGVVSTGLTERMNAAERDIKDLKTVRKAP